MKNNIDKLKFDEKPREVGFFEFDDKNLKNWINKHRYKINRNYNLIANIERLNGETITIYVKAEYDGFIFNKKRYIIDTTFKYYNQTFKNYCLDYHEEFALPIDRRINVLDVRNQLEKENIDGIKEIEVKNMINPYILEQFVKSNLAEGILKGNKINKVLEFVKIWVMIGTIATIILLMLYIYKSGMLEGVL